MKLIDIKFSEDKKYILAEYEEERKDGLYSHFIEVPIQFYPAGPLIRKDSFDEGLYYPTIDFGFGQVEANGDIIRKTNLIKQRIEEMTIADIEKKLGYKVKLVSEEKECVNREDD